MKNIYLNEKYRKSCKISYNQYENIENNIVIIDNFFENFNEAKNFFINRDKWKCEPYQGNSKFGYESLFPSWIGKSLMENFINKNKITVLNSIYDTVCNYTYYVENSFWSLSNTSLFPHIDSFEYDEFDEMICLINLNDTFVSTKFYKFKNNPFCTHKIKNEWTICQNQILQLLLEYYKINNIQSLQYNQIKEFLDFSMEKFDIKIDKNVVYNPNQAILYPANMFHQANVTKNFTIDFPRILLRITFYIKKEKNKNRLSYF